MCFGNFLDFSWKPNSFFLDFEAPRACKAHDFFLRMIVVEWTTIVVKIVRASGFPKFIFALLDFYPCLHCAEL